MESIKDLIREIPDYPKPGILFKDISPVLEDGAAFKMLVDTLVQSVAHEKPTKIVGIESRGFILGAALATKLNIGFVMIRKKGKLPGKRLSHTYQLEYGTDTVEIHDDALSSNDRIVVVDDVLATGGTAVAAIELCKRLHAEVRYLLVFIELVSLQGRERIKDVEVRSLCRF